MAKFVQAIATHKAGCVVGGAVAVSDVLWELSTNSRYMVFGFPGDMPNRQDLFLS